MELERYGGKLSFHVAEDKPQQQKATITISSVHVNALYNVALRSQKKLIQTFGFPKGDTPIGYIEQNFRAALLEHVKEVLFTHCVVHFLYQSLRENKLVVMGDPDLISIILEPNSDAQFIFSVQTINLSNDNRWKRTLLKPVERKHYKDLDRQVTAFINEELELQKKYTDTTISLGDWVNFEISIHDADNNPLMIDYTSNLWIRMASEEGDKDQQDLFLGRKKGDSFSTQSVYLQSYMSLTQDMEYTYHIVVKDFIPSAYFCFDLLRHQFGLKPGSDPLQTVVEVFSTRRDVTLRREKVEAVLKGLIKQYFFLIPQNLLDHQAFMVHKEVQDSTDYHVYKSHEDFKKTIYLLAEKQLREAIILDTLAYQEGITVTDQDIHAYLHLLTRPRMREFVYFAHPAHRVQGQDVPVSAEIIKRYCMREKMLNIILHTLTKKAK